MESDVGNCSPRYLFAESNTGRMAVHHSRVSRLAWRDAMIASECFSLCPAATGVSAAWFTMGGLIG